MASHWGRGSDLQTLGGAGGRGRHTNIGGHTWERGPRHQGCIVVPQGQTQTSATPHPLPTPSLEAGWGAWGALGDITPENNHDGLVWVLFCTLQIQTHLGLPRVVKGGNVVASVFQMRKLRLGEGQ